MIPSDRTHPWHVIWGDEGIRCHTWRQAWTQAFDIARSPSAPRPRVFRVRR